MLFVMTGVLESVERFGLAEVLFLRSHASAGFADEFRVFDNTLDLFNVQVAWTAGHCAHLFRVFSTAHVLPSRKKWVGRPESSVRPGEYNVSTLPETPPVFKYIFRYLRFQEERGTGGLKTGICAA